MEYDLLISINSAAFTGGSYEVALYALQAAFHCAKEINALLL
jgi:hypothetical protein